MPVLAVCNYIQGLLSGLPMPGENTPPMKAQIIPDDPQVETDIPTAYVWPDPQEHGEESRDGPAATVPRNTGPGTPAGFKSLTHKINVYIVWMGPGDDPQAGPVWLGIIDAVMAAFRTTYPMPQVITDPWKGQQTQVADLGEKMRWRTALSALADQAYNRFDALIQCQVTEVIQA